MPVATAVITDAGADAAAVADGLSLQVAITHVAIGANKYTPTVEQVALIDRREIAPVLVGSAQGNQITLIAVFETAAYAGALYDVGEIGFYIGDPLAGGVLFAIISSPTFVGPRRTTGMPNYSATFTIALTGVPTGSVTVTFDPGAATALMALATHEGALNPHPQYSLGGAPLGMVAPFYSTAAPAGWLALSGQTVARADYAALWAHVQANSLAVTEATWATEKGRFSVGDGSTTFRLPDLRSEFVRSWDNGRGVDTGRTLASLQGSANLEHTHGVKADNGGFNTNTNNVVSGTDRGLAYTASTNPSGGTESRPRNVALLMCIKAT